MVIPNHHSPPSLRRWLLSRLMAMANANPSHDWYTLKSILLLVYGRRDITGYDLQRIEAECYRCEGSGCRHCVDGIHHITRTVLERWFIEDRLFHQLHLTRLTENQFERYKPQAKTFFTSRVQRRRVSPRLSGEAFLWLLLYVAPDIGWHPFWKSVLRPVSMYCTPGPYPLLHLQRLCFNLRFFPSTLHRIWDRLRTRLYPRLLRAITALLFPRGSRGQCPQIAAQAAYFGPSSHYMEVSAIPSDQQDIPF